MKLNLNPETTLVSLAAKLGPWLAPVPPAFFIARAAEQHLTAPQWVAIIIAIAIEATGIASAHNTLRAYTYNLAKRKSDPEAPTWLALLLSAGYFAIGITMATLSEATADITTYAPALFFVLAAIAYGNLALAADQTRRESAIAEAKAEAKAERKERHAERPRKSAERPFVREPSGERSPDLDGLLNQVREQTNGTPYSPQDVQDVLGLGRTKTFDLLKYGRETGQVEQIGRGAYQFAVENNGKGQTDGTSL